MADQEMADKTPSLDRKDGGKRTPDLKHMAKLPVNRGLFKSKDIPPITSAPKKTLLPAADFTGSSTPTPAAKSSVKHETPPTPSTARLFEPGLHESPTKDTRFDHTNEVIQGLAPCMLRRLLTRLVQENRVVKESVDLEVRVETLVWNSLELEML